LELNVNELDKYIRDANNNIAWRNHNVIMRVRLICYKRNEETERNSCYFCNG
jgi:hypothetical protein